MSLRICRYTHTYMSPNPITINARPPNICPAKSQIHLFVGEIHTTKTEISWCIRMSLVCTCRRDFARDSGRKPTFSNHKRLNPCTSHFEGFVFLGGQNVVGSFQKIAEKMHSSEIITSVIIASMIMGWLRLVGSIKL